jgi:hypothetical protein
MTNKLVHKLMRLEDQVKFNPSKKQDLNNKIEQYIGAKNFRKMEELMAFHYFIFRRTEPAFEATILHIKETAPLLYQSLCHCIEKEL